jgi:excisionase family DNA binding protein
MRAKLTLAKLPAPISRATPISELPDRMFISEVAAALGVSAGCVYGMVNRGELRAVKIGRLMRIPRSEVARLMAGEEPDSR